MIVLMDSVRTAKKDYPCDACLLFLDSGVGSGDMDYTDWGVVKKAQADKWRIKAGEKYRFARYLEDGKFNAYRAKLGMDDICMRLDLYED